MPPALHGPSLRGRRSGLNSKLFSDVNARWPVENLVEVRDVSFSYDVRPVLKGITLNVPKGKVVSIMGLSGCGKTTLLRLIGGSIKPSRGEVRVSGRVMHELGEAELYAMRRRMGMLFQFGALFTD